MSDSFKNFLLHFLGCVTFLMFPFLFSIHISDFSQLLKFKFFQEDMVLYAMLVLVFYLSYIFLIPSLLFRKKYFYFWIIIIVLAIAVTLLPRMLIESIGLFESDEMRMRPMSGGVPEHLRRPPPNWLISYGRFLFQFIIVIALAYIIKLNQKLKEVINRSLQAQLSFLKAQINPHFLFNTLNSVYALTISKSDDAPEAIVKLSGMMRYVITETQQEFVSLTKEINYITDYIDLQKIRLGDTVDLHFSVTGNIEGHRIAPLLIIPFVENAFKYGVNPEEASIIDIKIQVSDFEIEIYIYNLIHRYLNSGDDNNRIGIETTRKRLEMLYAGRYVLDIKSTESDFIVQLKISFR